MNRAKTFSIFVCLVLLAVALPPNARADEWNKKTILTVNEPLAVPGKILQPGKYVMKLMDSPANRHIVQIYNEDESKLVTTILAIPNERLQPTGKTQFGFWEMPANAPKALRSWFYPGDNFGQEFAYPKDIAAQIAKTNNENVQAIVSGEENLATAKVEPMTPQGTTEGESQSATANQNNASNSTTMAQTQPAPTEPNASSSATAESNTSSSSAQAQSTPAPSTNTTAQPATPAPSTNPTTTNQTSQTASASNKRLPSTGSPFPLIGLLGLLSVGSAMLVRVTAEARKRS